MAKKKSWRIFFDMDGTLTVFKVANSIEELLQPRYFRDLAPHPEVVRAAQILIASKDIEVYTLSAYMPESKYAVDEKNAWLDEHAPEVPADHRIFCPCGEDKSQYVPGGIQDTDILLDDYTFNLLNWKGAAVKLMNGINGTKGTWTGAALDMSIGGEKLAEAILAFVKEGKAFPTLQPKQESNQVFVYSVRNTRDFDYWAYGFEPYNRLIASGKELKSWRYELKWNGLVDTDETAESMRNWFGKDGFEDETPYLITSDIVVIRTKEGEKAYYIDPHDVKEVPGFLEERRRPECKLYMHGWCYPGNDIGSIYLARPQGLRKVGPGGPSDNVFSKLCDWAKTSTMSPDKIDANHILFRIYSSEENTEKDDPSVEVVFDEVGHLTGECEGGESAYFGFGASPRHRFYTLKLDSFNLLAVLEQQRGKYVHIEAEKL